MGCKQGVGSKLLRQQGGFVRGCEFFFYIEGIKMSALKLVMPHDRSRGVPVTEV